MAYSYRYLVTKGDQAAAAEQADKWGNKAGDKWGDTSVSIEATV